MKMAPAFVSEGPVRVQLAVMRAIGRAPFLPNIWAKKLLKRYISDNTYKLFINCFILRGLQ